MGYNRNTWGMYDLFALSRAEAAKQEAAKQEAAKQEAAKQEAAKRRASGTWITETNQYPTQQLPYMFYRVNTGTGAVNFPSTTKSTTDPNTGRITTTATTPTGVKLPGMGIVVPMGDQVTTTVSDTPEQTLRQKQDAYNRGRIEGGTDEAIKRLELLRSKNYNIAADGYWGAESEAAWNKYNTDLGYNQLTNGELMKLTLDQLARKAVTDNTRARYNALHAALAENEAIRARNAEAEKNALTYNGKTYDNFVLYNSAIFDARKAAEQLNRIIRDNNLKGTIQSAADLAGFNANSRRGRNHLNTANAAYTAKTAAEQNGGTWDEAGYVAGLSRRDRNRYLRMRRADSDGNIFNNYQTQAEVAMPEWYSKPKLELEKTIDMNSIRFNKKGGCMYKNGKRIPKHNTGNPIVYSRPEVLFLTDNFGLIDWTNYHKAGAVRPGNYVSYINGDDNEWEAVKTQDGSLPALLGIQLPNGYEKLTQKYNPITGELMGEELITYGETEALNDTVPYGSSFYKKASNYPIQTASNKLTTVNTRP